jgi:hypothetical protein
VWNSGLPLWPSGLMDLVVSWFLPFHPIAVMVLCFSGLVMKQRFDNLSYQGLIFGHGAFMVSFSHLLVGS